MQDTSSPIEELIEEFHAILKVYEEKPSRPIKPEAQRAIDLYRENLARLEKELREDNADLIPRYLETGLRLLLHLTGRPKDRIRLDTFGEGSYEPVFDITIVDNSTLSASDKFTDLHARVDRINDCWQLCLDLQYSEQRKPADVLQSAQSYSKLKWNGTKSELGELFGILHENGWFQTESKAAFFRQVEDCFIVTDEDKEVPVKPESLRGMSDRADARKFKQSLFKCLKNVENPRKRKST